MAEEITTETVEESSKGWIWTVIIILVMVGFAAFTVKTFVDDHNRNQNTAEDNSGVSRDNIAQEFQPPSTGDNGTPAPEIRGPEASIPNKPSVLGSEITTSSAPIEPVYVPYRNDAFGFSTMVPSDTQFVTEGNKLTAGSPQGMYFTITVYNNTYDDLDTVETQLRNSPSVTSVSRVNLGSIPAIQFTSPNFNNATSYAFVTNGRLYYLIGNFSRAESWQNLKFF